MAAQPLVDSLALKLWDAHGQHVYAVLDGASCPDLLDQLYAANGPEFICLYRGELDPAVAEVAPYLARLEVGTDFTDWVLGQGFGKHWNIFLNSAADLPGVRRHLRTLNIVFAEGKPLLYRYYDPRVLRQTLPGFGPEQLRGFFGPVSRFLAEVPGKAMLESFSVATDGALVESALPLTA